MDSAEEKYLIILRKSRIVVQQKTEEESIGNVIWKAVH